MPIKADIIVLWLRREEECRARAAQMRVPEARQRLLNVAERYKEMAEHASRALLPEDAPQPQPRREDAANGAGS
jgi:hypothetical protein